MMTGGPDEFHAKKLQYTHLNEVCHAALQQCGISPAELMFVSDTGNVIFRADISDASYCVRIYQEPRALAEIAAELCWLASLKHDTNLIVPEPIRTLSGDLIQEIATQDTGDCYQVVLFHWIPGEIIGGNFGAETAQQIGHLMAALHAHATTFDLPQGVYRDSTDWRGMGRFTAGLTELQVSRIRSFLTRGQLELCDEVAKRLASLIEAVSDQQNFGLIHNDLHTNNCLFHNGKIGIIDFDDCQFAPFTSDMAITISSFDNLPNQGTLARAFLRGYAETRALPPNYLGEIGAFMMERRLRLVRWVSTWPSVDYFPFGKRIIHSALKSCDEYMLNGKTLNLLEDL